MKRRMLPDFGEDGSRERMVLLATICAEPAATYSGPKSHYVTRCSRQRGIDQGIRMSGRKILLAQLIGCVLPTDSNTQVGHEPPNYGK
jgi:hypothetical protein